MAQPAASSDSLGLNVFKETEKTHVDVVSVHGLYGSREGTWIVNGSSWLEKCIFDRVWARIVQYGYSSGHESTVFTYEGIRDEATKLLVSLVELRNGPKSEVPIVFITHDIGGIIVKEALRQAKHDPERFTRIDSSTRGLIFFGCPHRSVTPRELEKSIVRLMATGPHHQRPSTIIDKATGLARAIRKINDDFFHSKSLAQTVVANVFSENQDQEQQVFDRFMATLDIPMESRMASNLPHAELPSLGSLGTFYNNRLETVLKNAFADQRLNPEFLEAVEKREIKHKAPPSLAVTITPCLQPVFSWIDNHPEFLQWLKGPRTGILHVHGRTNVSECSQYLFRVLEGMITRPWVASRSVYYFRFSAHDVRRNCLSKMATAFLNDLLQWRTQMTPLMALGVRPPPFAESWTDKDAWATFNDLRIRTGIGWEQIFVVDGLDECDESRNIFLSDILKEMNRSEQKLKIIITTTSNSSAGPDIKSILEGCPTIDLDQANEVSSSPTQFIEDPAAYARSLKGFGVGVLGLVRHAFVSEILEWALYSFRPLRSRELATALSCRASPQNRTSFPQVAAVEDTSLLSDIQECFGPLLVFKNDELHFESPDAREYLAKILKTVYKIPATRCHRDIARSCLHYLETKEVQERLGRLMNRESISPLEDCIDGADDFLSYAIRFYPAHGDRAITGNHPSQAKNDQELHVPSIVKQLYVKYPTAAYWPAVAPSSDPDPPFLSAWLAAYSVEEQKDAPTSTSLLTAVQLGQPRLVQTLLGTATLGWKLYDLQALLETAARSGEVSVLSDLMHHIMSQHPSFEWPPAFLCRITWLGLTDLVKLALEAGAAADSMYGVTGPYYNWRPLDFAVARSHTELVELLLRHTDLEPEHILRKSHLLNTASRQGDPDIVALLIQHGAEVDFQENEDGIPLRYAAVAGHYAVVRQLIAAGAAKSVVDTEMVGAVEVASGGHIKCLAALLDYGVDANVSNNTGNALGWASLNGHLETCRLLLDRGADINNLDDCCPVIVHAVQSGCSTNEKLQLIEFLLERGADINKQKDGDTALMAAVRHDKLEIARYLVERKADVNREKNDGSHVTATYYAAERGSAEMMRLLTGAGAAVNYAENVRGWSPLHAAIAYPDVVRVLLENDADIEADSKDGKPLYWAAWRAHSSSVAALLGYKPNLEARFTSPDGNWEDDGFTPLRAAVHRKAFEVAKLLLEAGADINAQKESDKTGVLHEAMSQNHEDMVALLLEYNVNLDIRDHKGRAALDYIGRTTPVSLVRRLVNRGMSIEVRDNYKFTPLCTAILNNNAPVVEYLVSKGADLAVPVPGYGSPLHIACQEADLGLVKFLLQSGADVDFLDPEKPGTPLQTACYYLGDEPESEDRAAIVTHLVKEAKAGLNIVAGLFGTALNVACLRCRPSTVRFLLDNGAATDNADETGRQAVHFAAMQTPEHIDILLEAGADFSVKDKMGRTALHYAATSGSIEMIEKLLPLVKVGLEDKDNDGWTPLLWAARPPYGRMGKPKDSHLDIVKKLLDLGADPSVVGEGMGRTWTPLEVAVYHEASDEIKELLTPKPQTDPKERVTKKGEKREGCYCDACLLYVWGEYYDCQDCNDFDLCFKCYKSKNTIHVGHTFVEKGFETIVGLEEDGASESNSVDGEGDGENEKGGADRPESSDSDDDSSW